MNNELLNKRLANLCSVKSIVTIAATGAVIYGFVAGKITGEQLMLIYSSIIAFYFGTQSQKTQDAIDKGAYRELKWSDLFDIFVDSAKSSAMTLFIIATSTAFAWLFAYAGISTQLVDFVVGMHLSATMYCLVVAVILLIFGTFLEGIATAVLLVPVLWPVAQALGVNVIHFGMIVSIANVVGTMTPPVAVNIFSAASVTKLSMGKIVHGQWPFFIGYVGFFFLVVFIPALSTFLL